MARNIGSWWIRDEIDGRRIEAQGFGSVLSLLSQFSWTQRPRRQGRAREGLRRDRELRGEGRQGGRRDDVEPRQPELLFSVGWLGLDIGRRSLR
jgi:hypothetical protein